MKPSSSPYLAPSQLPPRPQSTSALSVPPTNAIDEGQPNLLTPGPSGNQQKLSWRKKSSQKLRESWDSTQDAVLDFSTSATDRLSQTPLLGEDLRRQSELIGKDLRDTKRGRSGEDSLCEHCLGFPISACWADNVPPSVSYVIWETPLERLIRRSPWCPLCHLLLHILSRPQNDPLLKDAVARYVPQEVAGFSMPLLVQKDWSFIDRNWPFGRTSTMGSKSTFAFGEMEDMKERAKSGAMIAKNLYLPGLAMESPDRLSSGAQLLRAGRKDEQDKQIRYRKKVSLQVTLYTHKSTREPPGLLLVECKGYTGQLGSELQDLSRFHLRVADNRIPSNLGDGAKPMVYGRKVDPRWINLCSTRQWLWECETKHDTQCSQHGWEVIREKPEYLRVIDVRRRCLVVPGNPTCRYVALSYMWGGFRGLALTYANISDLMEEGGLTKFMDRIPRTILDAMEVVEALGEAYLWVDTLCKLQENGDMAKVETQQMDRIYGDALLTLVAASGTDADAGLQGVQRLSVAPDRPGVERYVQQIYAEFQGAHIIAPLDNTLNVESTPWNRRGWTFQERLLSRRLLVFAHNEVVWYCRGMICREDMENGDYGAETHPLEFLTLKSSWLASSAGQQTVWRDGSLETDRYGRTHLVRSGRLSEYVRAVEQYTPRQLTYKSDVLFAFGGLGSIFERSFESRLLFGLPEIILDVALLWRPVEPLTRRYCENDGQPVHFPSWSWAGWEGAVRYDRPFVMQRDGEGVITGYEHGALGEEGIRPLLRWHTWNPERGLFDPINGVSGRGFPLCREGMPPELQASAFIGDRSPSQFVPMGFVDTALLRSYHLMFVTSSATSFHLSPPLLVPSNTGLSGPGPAPLHWLIRSTGGRVVGGLTLDRLGSTASDDYQKEFVVLAETHKLMPDGGVGEFEDYLVMLVAKSQYANIYERLGLGNIDKAAFDSATPEVKAIILG